MHFAASVGQDKDHLLARIDILQHEDSKFIAELLRQQFGVLAAEALAAGSSWREPANKRSWVLQGYAPESVARLQTLLDGRPAIYVKQSFEIYEHEHEGGHEVGGNITTCLIILVGYLISVPHF